jgi:hypothetical protein
VLLKLTADWEAVLRSAELVTDPAPVVAGKGAVPVETPLGTLAEVEAEVELIAPVLP